MCTVAKRDMKSRRKAFTLIELLVVIAIISILAAILFPVFARAREQARKASCQSNLKQIGLGVMMYVQDYDGKFPIAYMGTEMDSGWYGDNALHSTRWYQVLYPYVKSKQIFVCPTAGPINYSGGYGWNIRGTGSPYNGFGYTASSWGTPSGTGPVTRSAVQESSRTILITDPASDGYSGNGEYAIGYSSLHYMPVLHGGQVGPFSGTNTLTNYTGGGNYLFADGHVKFLNATQSHCSIMWDVSKTLAKAGAPASCGTLKF